MSPDGIDLLEDLPKELKNRTINLMANITRMMDDGCSKRESI